MRLLLEPFERRVRSAPDALALEDTQTQDRSSYGQLWESSGRMAADLKNAGIGPGCRVALRGRSSVEMVIALLSVLRAGACYIPVDSSLPAARTDEILRDADVHAVLNDSDGWRIRDVSPKKLRSPASDAYILYTSGSTGEPKGVVHTHESARAFVDWCIDTFQLNSMDRVLSVAPLHFDLSIFDLFVSLSCGSTVILPGEDAKLHPRALSECAAAARVSVLYTTPTLLRLLLRHGQLGESLIPLRMLLFAGEVLGPEDLDELRAHWPRARFYNLYGPTETNVCAFFDATSHRAVEGAIPIGRVCPYDRARISEEGELSVSGASVMREYWNKPDQDQASFSTDADGTRWYRTGDLVRTRADGQWIFAGRRDRQVKRRGHRIELGAIEAVLRTHPQVADAAVTVSAERESGVSIRAHVAGRRDGAVTEAILREYLAARLSAQSLPDRIVIHASLPRSSSGKIDYQALGGPR